MIIKKNKRKVNKILQNFTIKPIDKRSGFFYIIITNKKPQLTRR